MAMPTDLKKMYRTIMDDHFPPQMEISFVDGKNRQTLVYDKVTWVIEGVEKGLRYGENPGQEAALYRLVNGNLVLGEAIMVKPGRYLASDVELLHPGDAEEEAAWELFRARPDKSYSLTDCLSFVIMKRHALDIALTTDEHFRQEGFRILP